MMLDLAASAVCSADVFNVLQFCMERTTVVKKQNKPGRNWTPIESDYFFTEDSKDEKTANLTKWLKKTCPSKLWGLENLYTGDFNKGGNMIRGLGATRNIKKGEFFVCIPQDCWFGPPSMPKELVFETHPTGTWDKCDSYQFRAAIWMSLEQMKAEKSKWFHYFETQPDFDSYKHYHPSMLDMLEEEEYRRCLAENNIEVTEGTELDDESVCHKPFKLSRQVDYWADWYSYLHDCYAEYKDNFDIIYPPESRVDEYTKQPVPWGLVKFNYVRVMTRDFAVVGNIPLMDLPNTDKTYNAHQFYGDEAETLFCFRANKNIKKGEEVLVNYAQTSKAPLIFHMQYGFWMGPDVHEKEKMPDPCRGLGPNDEIQWRVRSGPGKLLAAYGREWCDENGQMKFQDIMKEPGSHSDEL